MRRAVSAVLVAAFAAAAPAAQERCPSNMPSCHIDYGPYAIFFDTGSSRITGMAVNILNSFNWYLRNVARDIPVIFALGRTDRVGPADANLELSCRRAEAARQWLVALGIPVERIVALGAGEEDPLVPTPDNVDEPQNRAVEFRMSRSRDEAPGRPWVRCAQPHR